MGVRTPGVCLPLRVGVVADSRRGNRRPPRRAFTHMGSGGVSGSRGFGASHLAASEVGDAHGIGTFAKRALLGPVEQSERETLPLAAGCSLGQP